MTHWSKGRNSLTPLGYLGRCDPSPLRNQFAPGHVHSLFLLSRVFISSARFASSHSIASAPARPNQLLVLHYTREGWLTAVSAWDDLARQRLAVLLAPRKPEVVRRAPRPGLHVHHVRLYADMLQSHMSIM